MRITPVKLFSFNNDRRNNNNFKISLPKIVQLQGDTVSFGLEKKSQITEPLDKIVVEQFGLDVLEFKSSVEIQNRCRTMAEDILQNEYRSETTEVSNQRKEILGEWKKYLLESSDTSICGGSGVLLVAAGITRDLKEKNKAIPPRLDKEALRKTMNDIYNYAKENQNSPNCLKNISFKKIYENKLREIEMLHNNANLSNGWIVIPSKEHDSAQFTRNVEKLKTLSHRAWCTKSILAEEHLAKGDIHIYYQNGKPRLAIRFENNEIAEIQGVKNNSQIPSDYLSTVENYIRRKGYSLSSSAEQEINNALENQKAIHDIHNNLHGKNPENCSAEEIFAAIGIDVQRDTKDGLYIISHFGQPSKDFTFEDLGVNMKKINKLLKNTKIINGDADFSYSTVNDLSNLEQILGNANFQHSQVTKLPKLSIIAGNANFTEFKIDALPNLETIGGDGIFFEAQVRNLPKLQNIGGNADFFEAKTSDLSLLETIGKDAHFYKASIQSLPSLKTIGGNAVFFQSSVKQLPKLESIGGEADFKESKVTNLPSLRECASISWDGHSICNYEDLVKRGIKFMEPVIQPSPV